MPSNAITDLTLYENTLRHGHFRLRETPDLGHALDVDEFVLASRFLPIFSRAHGRPVGHRARLRTLRNGDELSMETAAGLFAERGLTDRVEALAPGLHMHNYSQRIDEGWLALAVPDAVISQASLWPPLPQDLFSSDQYAPHDLILEVSAEAASSTQIADFANYHKALGFLVALRDFGVQSADLATVWSAGPDLVEVSVQILYGQTDRSRRSRTLDALSRVLHECGAMVALVDVDDEADLVDGLAAEVDFFSGDAVQNINEPLPAAPQAAINAERLQQALRDRLALAAERIAAGEIFESACEPLLSEPAVIRCYLLDDDGVQLAENLSRVGTRSDPRFWPLAKAAGANWAHRDYFRTAREHPGQVMRTGPYLSVPDGRHCVTLSVATGSGDSRVVLCADTAEDAVPDQSSL